MIANARLFNVPKMASNPSQAAKKSSLPIGWQLWDKKRVEGQFGPVDVFSKDIARVFWSPGKEPYSVDTPLGRIISAYKAEIGVAPWDRAWDASISGFARHSKAARALLDDLGLESALKCLSDCASYFKLCRVDWSLKAVAERAMDWKSGRIFELMQTVK